MEILGKRTDISLKSGMESVLSIGLLPVWSSIGNSIFFAVLVSFPEQVQARQKYNLNGIAISK